MTNVDIPQVFLEATTDYVRGALESTGTRSAKLATVDENFPADPFYSFGAMNPRVTFDGDTTLSQGGFAILPHAYTPTAGDRVVMLPVGNTYVIVGSVDAARRVVMLNESFDLPTSLATYTTTPSVMGTVDILDPGYTYHIEAYAQGEMGSAVAGTRWDAEIRYNDPVGGNLLVAISPIPTGVTEFTQIQGIATGITGPITVRLELKRVSGAGNGQMTQFNSKFYVKTLPARY